MHKACQGRCVAEEGRRASELGLWRGGQTARAPSMLSTARWNFASGVPFGAKLVRRQVRRRLRLQHEAQQRHKDESCASYEELQSLFHSNSQYKHSLYTVVADINAGRCHPEEVAILGESLLVGLKKPDGGTRPIGIGAALRRLAGRCLMVDRARERDPAPIFGRLMLINTVSLCAGASMMRLASPQSTLM